jgi:hypothetical protein
MLHRAAAAYHGYKGFPTSASNIQPYGIAQQCRTESDDGGVVARCARALMQAKGAD